MSPNNHPDRISVIEDPEEEVSKMSDLNTIEKEEITLDECLGNKSQEPGVVPKDNTPEDIRDSAHRSDGTRSSMAVMTMAAKTMQDWLARAKQTILLIPSYLVSGLIEGRSYEDPGQEEEIAQYDIFLSFRGLDTRKKFAAHLYKELKREGFKAFRDDKNMLWGKVINSELHKAISNSRTSVVILSENFANSTACLFEIQTMLEQCKLSNHLILPVFYEIQPEQIKDQAKNLNFENEKVSVEEQARWSAALEEVANMSGVASQNYSSEPELIENIIHKLRSRLDDESLRVADGLLVSAAIKIQQMYRGWKGRKKFLKMRKLAVKIQAYYRGHQARLSEARDNRDHNTLL